MKELGRKENGTFERFDYTGATVNGIVAVRYLGKSEKNGYVLYETKCSFCGKESVMPSYRFARNAARCDCEEWKRRFAKPLGRKRVKGERGFLIRHYKSYIKSARERGLVFKISPTDFERIVSSPCFYCGAEPSSKNIYWLKDGHYRCNGIDRKDNSKGYTIENCVPCCPECNFCKGSLSKDEFLKLVKKVYEYRVLKGE